MTKKLFAIFCSLFLIFALSSCSEPGYTFDVGGANTRGGAENAAAPSASNAKINLTPNPDFDKGENFEDGIEVKKGTDRVAVSITGLEAGTAYVVTLLEGNPTKVGNDDLGYMEFKQKEKIGEETVYYYPEGTKGFPSGTPIAFIAPDETLTSYIFATAGTYVSARIEEVNLEGGSSSGGTGGPSYDFAQNLTPGGSFNGTLNGGFRVFMLDAPNKNASYFLKYYVPSGNITGADLPAGGKHSTAASTDYTIISGRDLPLTVLVTDSYASLEFTTAPNNLYSPEYYGSDQWDDSTGDISLVFSGTDVARLTSFASVAALAADMGVTIDPTNGGLNDGYWDIDGDPVYLDENGDGGFDFYYGGILYTTDGTGFVMRVETFTINSPYIDLNSDLYPGVWAQGAAYNGDSGIWIQVDVDDHFAEVDGIFTFWDDVVPSLTVDLVEFTPF